MDNKTRSFEVIDFIIFTGLFVLSATVGAIFAYRDRKKQSTDNYYFGGKAISPLLVSVSIAVSFVSAVAIVAVPAEVYLHGSVYLWYKMGFFVASVIAVLYYVPLFHRLQVSSVYEYLELRFHRRVRVVASVLGIFNMTMIMAITIYLPSLALNAVTPLNLYWTIFLTSAVCTIYTALGGMKAVLWADAMQCAIMVTGMCTILGTTISSVGGIRVLMEKVELGGRNNFLTFDMDPTERTSAPAALIGGTTTFCYVILCNQIYIQRYLSCKSVKASRKSVLLSLIPVTLLTVTSILLGLALFAYYDGCDPLRARTIDKPDELMPLLAIEMSRSIPGLGGLFVAAAFCGTMSTVSSGINALSAIFMMDFCIPNSPDLSERKRMILSKTLTVLFGILVMGVSYLVSIPSTNIVEFLITVNGFFAGPMVGLFTMGLFMPWINSICASIGFALGTFCVGLVGISSMVAKSGGMSVALPTSVEDCVHSQYNVSSTTLSPYTEDIQTTFRDEIASMSAVQALGSLSPFLYGILGILVTIVGANIVWLFLGGNDVKTFDERLFTPLVESSCLSKNVRLFFRCGVPVQSNGKDDAVLGDECGNSKL